MEEMRKEKINPQFGGIIAPGTSRISKRNVKI
jgi:hypothetical protein